MPDDQETGQLATLQQMVKLQAQVAYMNVDRNLATWTRTALALIVSGIAVDRFGLLMTHNRLAHLGTRLAPNPESSLGGIMLVAIGTFVAIAAGIRHEAYRAVWNRVYRHNELPHGPYLAFTFAVLAAIFGIAMLAALLVFVQ
ncbi:MAG: YidH family protein [Rhodanobacteraceae bacterium]